MGASGPVPLHLVGYSGPASLSLLVAVTLAGLGAAGLLGLALAALVRRQSRPYLLIAGAVCALLGRSAAAGLALVGVVSARSHHLVEHGLDVAFVALVVAAVYYARSVSREASER